MLRLSGSGLDRGSGRQRGCGEGQRSIQRQCAVCHNADSTDRRWGPGLKGLFKHDKLVNGKKVTDATVREKIDKAATACPLIRICFPIRKKTT